MLVGVWGAEDSEDVEGKLEDLRFRVGVVLPEESMSEGVGSWS